MIFCLFCFEFKGNIERLFFKELIVYVKLSCQLSKCKQASASQVI